MKRWYLFLPAFILVLVCSSLLLGIHMNENNIEASTKQSYDSSHFWDYLIWAEDGITESDLELLNAHEDVLQTEVFYASEYPAIIGEVSYRLCIFSKNEALALFNVTSGREPANAQECMVDSLLAELTGCKLGDTIKRNPEYAFPVGIPENEQFTIVGFCDSKLYLNSDRRLMQDASIGTTGFIVAPKDCFTGQASYAMLRLKSAENLSRYSDVYLEMLNRFQSGTEQLFQAMHNKNYQIRTMERQAEYSNSKMLLASMEDYLVTLSQEREEKLDRLYLEWETAKQLVEEERIKLEERRELLYKVDYTKEDADLVLKPAMDKLEEMETAVKTARQQYTDAVEYYKTAVPEQEEKIKEQKALTLTQEQELNQITCGYFTGFGSDKLTSYQLFANKLPVAEQNAKSITNTVGLILLIAAALLILVAFYGSLYEIKEAACAGEGFALKLLFKNGFLLLLTAGATAIGGILAAVLLQPVLFDLLYPGINGITCISGISLWTKSLLALGKVFLISAVPGMLLYNLFGIIYYFTYKRRFEK